MLTAEMSTCAVMAMALRNAICSGSKALTSIDANITVICTVYSTVIAACKWCYQQPQQKNNEGLTHCPR